VCTARGILLQLGSSLFTTLGVVLFAQIKRYILVLDHMLDLSSHSDSKEDAEVDQKNGPEHRNIKYAKETANKSNEDSLGGGVPKLELGQSSNERPEFFIILGWE
jgi:hypothetical protein